MYARLKTAGRPRSANGSKLRADFTPDWLRLYLSQGTCGNTLARFITNLQRTYNAALHAYGDVEQQVLALD